MDKLRISGATANRWYSTGFMIGGVGSVDAGAHTLKDAVMIRPGEALGHGVWIDQAFCADVATRCGGAGDKGLKARFGHPNMCSEALGTFLGRWKGGRVDENFRVLADLHLSSTAAESPKGDLRKYVEEMAAKEPQHFGASIVFTMDMEAIIAESIANGAKEKEDDYGTYLDFTDYKSPDPANVKNLPHARCAELHAADLVDDPAATDGMFAGASGMSLAAQMTEFLDTHPEVFKAMNDEPELLNIVTRYADQLRPFLARYTANAQTTALAEGDPAAPVSEEPEPDEAVICPHCGKDINAPIESPEAAAESAPAPAQTPPAAEPAPELTARVAELEALNQSAREESERITAELATARTERDAAIEASKTAEAARVESDAKLAAMLKGQPPVSVVPAEGIITGTLMQRARKAKTS